MDTYLEIDADEAEIEKLLEEGEVEEKESGEVDDDFLSEDLNDDLLESPEKITKSQNIAEFNRFKISKKSAHSIAQKHFKRNSKRASKKLFKTQMFKQNRKNLSKTASTADPSNKNHLKNLQKLPTLQQATCEKC